MPERRHNRRVGVFGGSFDPPHLGHALVTTWALATTGVDEVWWVPTWQHAFGKRSVPFETRLELCALAARHFVGVDVCPVEGELGGESRTIDTLEELERRHPDTRFELVVGSDLLEELPRWKRSDDLRRYPMHVVTRGGAVRVDGTPEIPDVSSTGLRVALAARDEARAAGQMDYRVLERVLTLGLYVGEDGGDRG